MDTSIQTDKSVSFSKRWMESTKNGTLRDEQMALPSIVKVSIPRRDELLPFGSTHDASSEDGSFGFDANASEASMNKNRKKGSFGFTLTFDENESRARVRETDAHALKYKLRKGQRVHLVEFAEGRSPASASEVPKGLLLCSQKALADFAIKASELGSINMWITDSNVPCDLNALQRSIGRAKKTAQRRIVFKESRRRVHSSCLAELELRRELFYERRDVLRKLVAGIMPTRKDAERESARVSRISTWPPFDFTNDAMIAGALRPSNLLRAESTRRETSVETSVYSKSAAE
eukprot:g4693.t1